MNKSKEGENRKSSKDQEDFKKGLIKLSNRASREKNNMLACLKLTQEEKVKHQRLPRDHQKKSLKSKTPK